MSDRRKRRRRREKKKYLEISIVGPRRSKADIKHIKTTRIRY
jgi:hypothetical protein